MPARSFQRVSDMMYRLRGGAENLRDGAAVYRRKAGVSARLGQGLPCEASFQLALNSEGKLQTCPTLFRFHFCIFAGEQCHLPREGHVLQDDRPTTVSGTAINIPGIPHSKPHSDNAKRITSGLSPTARPTIIGSIIAAFKPCQIIKSVAMMIGVDAPSHCKNANPAGKLQATTVPRYGIKLQTKVSTAQRIANFTPKSHNIKNTGIARTKLELTFAFK